MLVYNYDFTTFEYIGSEEASLDPAETKKQGKDVYLIPANATLKKPPKIKENQVAIFNEANGSWKILPDYRGKYAVNYTMTPILIETLGALPEGYVFITLEQIELLEQYGSLYFIIQNNELIVNPNYEEDKRKEEEKEMLYWHMTKYDFFKYICQPYGITYSALTQIINSNDDIAAAWNLCAYVYLGDELLSSTVQQFIPELTIDRLKEIFREHRIKD